MARDDRSPQTKVYLLLGGEIPGCLAESCKHLGPLIGPVPRPCLEDDPRFSKTYGPVPRAETQNPSGFFLDRYVY